MVPARGLTEREYGIVKLKIVATSTVILFYSGLYSQAQAKHFHFHHAVQHSAYNGYASWYGPGFQGHRTANGERFNTYGYTAAHRSLPLGCRVLVTNRVNGRSVVVRINDRGPFGTGKVIDLSRASAQAIGMSGSAPVSLSRL